MSSDRPGRTYVLREKRKVNRPIDEVFAYAADFSNSADWDPGVQTSVPVTPGDPSVGKRYDLVGHFGPAEIPMRYEVIEWGPPNRVVLEGSGDSFDSTDTMEFAPVTDGGTEITYTAEIAVFGAIRFLGPLMNGPFRRMGERAVDGLVASLER